MKRFIIAAAIALATSLSAFAQGEQSVDLGLNVGAGFITAQQKISATAGGQSSSTTQSGLGFYLNVGASSDLGLAGLGYTMDIFFDHWSLSPDEVAAGVTSNTKENYLGFAMQLNIALDVSESVCFRPFFGPGFSYGLSSKTHGHTEVDYGGQHYEEDTNKNNYEKNSGYSRTDAYLTVGADILLKPAHLRIRGGVDFGMWDRDTIENSKTKDGPNLRLGVAYLF